MKIEVPGKTYKQISKLDLSGQNLTSFPQEIFKCTNLRKLNLNNNSISEIPKQITILRKLKVLNLSHNNVTQLYANIFKLPQLSTLDVSNNLLKTIPNQIQRSGITILIANNNAISTIDEKSLSNIEKLNLCNNCISHFEILNFASKIRQLWIGFNPISLFKINIKMAPALKQIYAYSADNKISSDYSDDYIELAKIKGNSLNLLLMQQNKIKMNKSVKSKQSIFISYSHNDDPKWLKMLQKNLKVLQNVNNSLEYWDDTRIKTGDNWKEEIESALEISCVAILLVSTDFLASDFIQNHELPKLLDKAKKDGTKICPIIIEHCLFEHYPEISKFQAVNKPDEPLSEDPSKAQKIMVQLMKDILEILK